MATAKQTEDVRRVVKTYIAYLLKHDWMDEFIKQVAANPKLDALNIEQIIEILEGYDGADLNIPLMLTAILDDPENDESIRMENDWLYKQRKERTRTNPS